ncbi:MAG: DUF126 domain-containing protein [Methanomicrobiales archaeon]|nr:DUF126 domain-containing protein [Methanomicrobiales archaeon]
MKGRGISGGTGRGPLLFSPTPLSFLGGVDPSTGAIVEHGHPREGTLVRGTVLVFDHGKGSTVGSYVLYALARQGLAPAAIINAETEPIIAVGAIIGKIPLVDRLEIPLTSLRQGTILTVNGDTGEVIIDEESP